MKAGVIGVGYLGKYHAQKYKAMDGVELVGVADVDSVLAETIAKENNCKAFTDYRELLQQVDAVSVVVPTSYHHKVALDCIEAGVDMLMEKPITTTVEEADEIIGKASEKKLILQVGHLERFNPAVEAMIPSLTVPVFIESQRISTFKNRGVDVDVVLDLMIHDIDIILNLIDSKVTQIDASGVSVITDNIDIANVRIGFENGAVANVTASRISLKKMRKFRMFQKDKYISLDFDKGSADIFMLTEKNDNTLEGLSVGEIEETGKKIVYSNKLKENTNALLEENKDFVNSILNDKPVTVSGEDGLKALEVAIEIIDKIEKTMEKNK